MTAAADAELPDGDVPPRKVYLELTTHCNLTCAMCMRSTWESPGGTMSAETFRRTVRQLADLPGAVVVNLSGFGEPMTHPRFFDFLAEAREAGLGVEVVTNGTLLDAAAAARLVDLQVDRVVVSVDGMTAAASRMLHARSLPEIEPGLRALREVRLSRRSGRPEVAIQFVATRRNIHELPRLKAMSLALGFSSILVTNLVPHTAALAGEILYGRISTAWRGGRPAPGTPCVDLPLLDADCEATAVVERLRRLSTPLRVNGVDVAGAGPRCRFITEGRFAVGWDGAVSPCLSLLHTHTYYFRGKGRRVRCYHVGNVHAAPLGAIWAGRQYRAFRARVRSFAFSPCIDCGGCELRDTNETDCTGDEFPRCGECLYAAGLVQCP